MKMMSNSIKGFLTTGVCFAFLIGMASCGGDSYETTEEAEVVEEDAGVMDNWDNERFNSDFTSNNRFGEWDANDDDFLDENEYSTGFFNTWDTNRDNMVDQNEFNTASNDFKLNNQNWADWDTNKDNNLDENEFRAGFANTSYYKDWDKDRDNRVSSREYSDGIFSLWDDNRDGSLDNNEYNERYNRYYGM